MTTHYETKILYRLDDADEYVERDVICDLYIEAPDSSVGLDDWQVDCEVVRDADTLESLLVDDDEVEAIEIRVRNMLERYGQIIYE